MQQLVATKQIVHLFSLVQFCRTVENQDSEGLGGADEEISFHPFSSFVPVVKEELNVCAEN